MKKITLLFSLFLLNITLYSQNNPFFTKPANSSIELGLGAGFFNSVEDNTAVRLQLAKRDVILNKFGFYYTYEFSTKDGVDNNDLLGLNYRLSNKFSIQVAGEFLTNESLFKYENARKELSFVYEPIKTPLSFTLGYSNNFGPTITFNYKFFRKKNVSKSKESSVEKNFSSTTTKPFNKDSSPSNQLNNSSKTNSQKDDIKSINNSNTKKNITNDIKSNINLQNTKPSVNNSINKTSTIKKDVDTLLNKQVAKRVIKKENSTKTTKPDYKKICDDNKVPFAYNSSSLSAADKRKLQNFASVLTSNKKLKLKIIGRTDKIGSDAFNLVLGQKRADSAKTFLVSKGVNESQLISTSVGEKYAQNANTPEERAIARTTLFEFIF